jgi:hypothetical protein
MLRAIASDAVPDINVYRPAQFDLDVQPLRPGVAHESIELVLEPGLADAVEEAAAADGLPTSLWAAIAIESERALRALASTTAATPAALMRMLDDTARHREGGLAHQRGRRLVRYALALDARAPRARGPAQSRLMVAVAQHTLIAWELAAAGGGELVERWATQTLGRLPAGRGSWESAAALVGQTLGEWVAAQAARLSSD